MPFYIFAAEGGIQTGKQEVTAPKWERHYFLFHHVHICVSVNNNPQSNVQMSKFLSWLILLREAFTYPSCLKHAHGAPSHSQSPHSSPSQKEFSALFSATVVANWPHVLSMAKVGTACTETLSCLSSSVCNTVGWLSPRIWPCFYFLLSTAARRRQRQRQNWGMEEGNVTEGNKVG